MNAAAEQRIRKWAARSVAVLGVAASVYHLYAAYFYPLFALQHRAVHWMFMATILFLVYPILHAPKLTWRQVAYSGAFIALAMASGIYVLVNYAAVGSRAGAYNAWDVAFGVMLLLVVFEAARRGTGWPVVLVALAFLAYAFAGPYLPPLLGHRGFAVERVVPYLYLTTDGVFGVPLGVSAKFVLLFILYGAILEKSGAGKFFLDLAMSVAGGTRGGPAKAGVISSAVLGTVSGSSVANTTTTGTFTIPLMKRIGVRAEMAGGIEAAASTMGQVIPPVMGAAAFLLAEYIGVPYARVAVAAVIPALLAMWSMFLQVDFLAGHTGMRGLPAAELPDIWTVFRQGAHFLLPLLALFYFLLGGYSPERAVLWTILLTVAVVLISGWRQGRLRETGRALAEAFAAGGVNTVTVAAICAAAGVIIGMTTMTGLGLRISGIVIDLAGGRLWLAAPLAAVSSLILGMGIPTTANYVIQATLVAPALIQMGVPVLAAHMFVFYFGVIADITPPVALASYAAAGIAQSNPFRTGVEAFRFGLAKYIVPFLFLYQPALLMQDSWLDVTVVSVLAALGITALSAMLQRYFFGSLAGWQMILLAAAALLLFSMRWDAALLGAALMIAVAGAQKWSRRARQPGAAMR
ncbi:MAG: TRAP transporter permease [Firmicutes bacterium]|nr:TRAP transporter permease [Bacillota bacterium]